MSKKRKSRSINTIEAQRRCELTVLFYVDLRGSGRNSGGSKLLGFIKYFISTGDGHSVVSNVAMHYHRRSRIRDNEMGSRTLDSHNLARFKSLFCVSI